MNKGIVCSITNEMADFEETCENFEKDESVKEEDQVEKSNTEVLSQLSEESISKLRPHQDLTYAIVGGLFLSVICALAWAIVTIITEYQIGFMAVGVGFIVGMGVRFFGAGVDPIFGIVGAFLALLGCLLGNLFSQVGFIADAQSLGYFETLTFLDMETIFLIYKDSFSIMDLLFYGIAVFEGYKFAFRKIPENVEDLNDLTPAFSNLRLPLVIACFLVLSVSGFTLSKGVTGTQEFYYESGAVMSRGELVNGKENGQWEYFYEDGGVQVTASYVDGIENGRWEWYSVSGDLMQKGNYKNGLFDGTWITYTEGGNLLDSSNYLTGRLHGVYKSYYDNGVIYQTGEYYRDRQIGEWKIYHDNGNLNAKGSFEDGEPTGTWEYLNYNGTPHETLNYTGNEKIGILNSWNNKGHKTVVNGNGKYTSYYDDKNVWQEGMVEEGIKVGLWKTYSLNGKVKEVGKYEDEKYIIITAWNDSGIKMVEDGNGEYISYFESLGKVSETGRFKNGLRDGEWILYYPGSDVIQQESTYKNGNLSGRNVTYSANGIMLIEGVFENGKKVGEWKWYYESGQLQCTITYVDDKKEGDQIFFSESGREAKRELYENGELISEELL